jgi:hypothetical protein
MIESLLPIKNIYSNLYNEKISNGKQFIKDKNITILSLVRDCDHVLSRNIETICSFLSNYCLSYKILFLENDSSDNTKQILHDTKNNNIEIFSFNFNREKFGSIKSYERIKALAEYRNFLKEKVLSINSDYVIVLDFDFQDISINGLLNSFGWIKDNSIIKAIAGNSFEYKLFSNNDRNKNLWNYDSWAYRGSWWQDLQLCKPTIANNIDPMLWFGFWILPRGSQPVSVNSAFGGCCIYDSKYYIDSDIKYTPDDCEHVTLHYNLYKKYNDFKLYLNPSQVMLF